MARGGKYPNGKHDAGLRRKADRRGGEKGARIYVPEEVLEALGMADAEQLYFRTWAYGGRGGAVLVRLYRER